MFIQYHQTIIRHSTKTLLIEIATLILSLLSLLFFRYYFACRGDSKVFLISRKLSMFDKYRVRQNKWRLLFIESWSFFRNSSGRQNRRVLPPSLSPRFSVNKKSSPVPVYPHTPLVLVVHYVYLFFFTLPAILSLRLNQVLKGMEKRRGGRGWGNSCKDFLERFAILRALCKHDRETGT